MVFLIPVRRHFYIESGPWLMRWDNDCPKFGEVTLKVMGELNIIILICGTNSRIWLVWKIRCDIETQKVFFIRCRKFIRPLHWRHNDHDGVSNHQPHGCLLNRLFRRRSKKTSKLLVTGLCVGNSPGPVNSPHKGPVTRQMIPFYDVIMHAETLTWKGAGVL